jgi:hypothetical protein
MNIDDLFPSKYLKPGDLAGRQCAVTIERIEVAEIGWPRQRKVIVHFVGKQKALVLNRENARRLADLTNSTETDHWVGRRIRLGTEQVQFQGKPMLAVRVVPRVASPAAEHQTADRTGQSENAPAPSTGPDRPEGFVRPDGQTDRREREREDGSRPRPGLVYSGKR